MLQAPFKFEIPDLISRRPASLRAIRFLLESFFARKDKVVPTCVAASNSVSLGKVLWGLMTCSHLRRCEQFGFYFDDSSLPGSFPPASLRAIRFRFAGSICLSPSSHLRRCEQIGFNNLISWTYNTAPAFPPASLRAIRFLLKCSHIASDSHATPFPQSTCDQTTNSSGILLGRTLRRTRFREPL